MKQRLFLITFLFVHHCFSQGNLRMPEESQKADVSQRIGITDIDIVYHSPAVKGRKIWGGLVPYNQVWRAGANQNTVISFTHDISISGHVIPAGKYGLHMIPGIDEWIIIFSKNNSSWGSFTYKQEEDQLRITVKPEPHAHTEWLTYLFTNKSANAATLTLLWEKMAIPVNLTLDVNKIVLSAIRNKLSSNESASWEALYQGAAYCYHNRLEFDQALKWLSDAEYIKPDAASIQKLKANLLYAMKNKQAGDSVMNKFLAMANEDDINTYGYELVSENKLKEALEIFRLNAKRFPASWNAYDSLGETLSLSGDKSSARRAYEEALGKAPENQQKRIESILQSLK